MGKRGGNLYALYGACVGKEKKHLAHNTASAHRAIISSATSQFDFLQKLPRTLLEDTVIQLINIQVTCHIYQQICDSVQQAL